MDITQQILNNFFNDFKDIVNVNDFYSISFTPYTIKLQGHFNTPLAQRLTDIGFVFEFKQHLNGKLKDDSGKSIIEITLT